MNTLEALIAVMLVFGLVLVLMNAHAEINEIVADPMLKEKIKGSHIVEVQRGNLAIGKGRESKGYNDLKTAYSRWYIV